MKEINMGNGEWSYVSQIKYQVKDKSLTWNIWVDFSYIELNGSYFDHLWCWVGRLLIGSYAVATATGTIMKKEFYLILIRRWRYLKRYVDKR